MAETVPVYLPEASIGQRRARKSDKSPGQRQVRYRWRLRQAGVYSLDAAREIKTRIPRRHTRARIAAAAAREQRRIERELLAAGIDPNTTTVDLETGEITQDQLPPPTL